MPLVQLGTVRTVHVCRPQDPPHRLTRMPWAILMAFSPLANISYKAVPVGLTATISFEQNNSCSLIYRD